MGDNAKLVTVFLHNIKCILQADVLSKLRHAICKALEDYNTRVEMQQVNEVEAEQQRKAQVKAARARVKQKRIRSQMRQDRRSYDDL